MRPAALLAGATSPHHVRAFGHESDRYFDREIRGVENRHRRAIDHELVGRVPIVDMSKDDEWIADRVARARLADHNRICRGGRREIPKHRFIGDRRQRPKKW